MGVLVTYLAGAATTLVVQLIIQFWMVPRVETRKRREDRWERYVLELGELLGASLSQTAQEAQSAQSLYRYLRYELEGATGVDPDKLAQEQKKEAVRARQSTAALQNLMNTRVSWLVNRITSFDEPKTREIVKFQSAARRHYIRVMTVFDYDNTGDDFEVDWDKEWEARKELMDCVQVLAKLQHPPRASLYRKVQKRLKKTKIHAKDARTTDRATSRQIQQPPS